eukprot:3351870-Pleurochrysis_carterae.AAC.3
MALGTVQMHDDCASASCSRACFAERNLESLLTETETSMILVIVLGMPLSGNRITLKSASAVKALAAVSVLPSAA